MPLLSFKLLSLTVLVCIQPYHVISFSSPSCITSSATRELDDDSKDMNIIEFADLNYKRRLFLLSSVSFSSLLGVTVASPAFAAKGAAEYDLEYYMRDLL